MPTCQRRRSASSRALSLSLAASLTGLSLHAAAADRVQEQPFFAVAQISELLAPASDASCQPTSTQPGLTASGTIQGLGHASVLGNFTVQSVDCVRSSSPVALLPPLRFNSTAFTLTTTNGDQVTVNYSGTATLGVLGLMLNGSYTITGGTGALRHVKGSGVLTGVENILTVPATGFVTFYGKISK